MLRRAQQLISLRDFRLLARQLEAPLVACLHSPALGEPQPGLEQPEGEPIDLGSPVGAADETPWVPAEQQLLLQTAIVGVPNAGKSTLINRLVGEKVSAVSPKTNTTSYSRLGALTEGPAQVVLYDTPGIVDSRHYKNPRHERRVKSAWAVAADCDLLLFLVDAHRQLARPDPRIERLLGEFGSGTDLGPKSDASWDPPPAVLVLNKVDAVPKEDRPKLIPMADKLRGLCSFEDVFWVSALHGRGVPDLRQFLVGRATPGRWVLEPDAATDRSEEEQALEVVREAVFRRFYAELPYEVVVVPLIFRYMPDGTVFIKHRLLVSSERVRKIIVGRQGAAIGAVEKGAQQELERLWKQQVRLVLEVKVVKKASRGERDGAAEA